MAYRIRYFGQDYSPIERADCELAQNQEEPDTGVSFDFQKILNSFIDRLDTNKLESIHVNFSAARKGKEDRIKSLRAGFNPGYFGGLCGIVKRRIRLLPQECLKDYQPDRDENTDEAGFEFDISLQLTSRFDAINRPFFLLTMLENAEYRVSNNYIPSNDEELFDYLLLFIYIKRLTESYQKGYFRTYSTFEKNDTRIKGVIDFARHIRSNMGLNNGNISYHYREKSVDNYLNHLIVEAYDALKKKHPELVISKIDNNFDLRVIINILKNSIDYPKYDRNTIIRKNMGVLAHPYYMEYEELRKISLRILRNEGLTVFDGMDDEVEGVLFYVPDLWEIYVGKILESAEKKSTGVEIKDQTNLTDSAGGIKIFSQKSAFSTTTYPDFVLYRDNGIPFMILDAKFKPSWGEFIANQSKIDSNDLPDYDKCIRDMNSIDGHAAGTIFPTDKESLKDLHEKYIRHSISEYNTVDRFYTFPVFVPVVDEQIEYEEWKRRFDDICEDVAVTIATYSEKEKDFHQEITDKGIIEKLQALRVKGKEDH